MRVVDALKRLRGVSDVTVEEGIKPVTVLVRFDPRQATTKGIGRAAKHALESDPQNRAPVKLVYEKGQ